MFISCFFCSSLLFFLHLLKPFLLSIFVSTTTHSFIVLSLFLPAEPAFLILTEGFLAFWSFPFKVFHFLLKTFLAVDCFSFDIWIDTCVSFSVIASVCVFVLICVSWCKRCFVCVDMCLSWCMCVYFIVCYYFTSFWHQLAVFHRSLRDNKFCTSAGLFSVFQLISTMLDVLSSYFNFKLFQSPFLCLWKRLSYICVEMYRQICAIPQNKFAHEHFFSKNRGWLSKCVSIFPYQIKLYEYFTRQNGD